MNSVDRAVRARIYELFVDGARVVDAGTLAAATGLTRPEVTQSMADLAAEHRIALADNGRVRMAHPFSGVPTSYRARIGERWWWANCAWDSLAILALLGDGEAEGPDGLTWSVREGRVEPDGIVHLLVPARSFWDDVGYT
ncbi:MAG: organomercurial lyase [Acidimicrobiia bacterium]